MFFITVFERPKNGGKLLLGTQRCWGFYFDLAIAVNAVKNNLTDLWETIYDYAVIEEIDQGICFEAKQCQWYKFNTKTKKYENIKKPGWAKGLCNFAIG